MIVSNENGLFLMRHTQLGERDWRNDECYKIIFSPFGDGVYQTSIGDIAVNQGSFFIFNPNVAHRQLKAGNEKLLVELNPSLLSQTTDQIGAHREPLSFPTFPTSTRNFYSGFF
ncbi:hypothetical protein [Halobacillus andaensis]|uniref:hypothetical protein n=1 Tax=Halobacillus andaensis TaxID=1176239 RepID=UPI003D73BA2B